MRFGLALSFGVTCIALGAANAAIASAQDRPFAIDQYLRDSIGLDDGQLADLQRGRVISKILPTESASDVSVVGVIGVHTTRDAYVARLGDIQGMLARRSNRFGVIGDPVTPADLAGISVDKSEYRGLRKCKINDCNFKLPASAMGQFVEAVDWNSRNAKVQVDSIFRLDLLRFVSDYRVNGNAAMMRYDDTGGTRSGEVFAALLAQSPYLRDYGGELRDYLDAYPARRPEGARDFLYWSEDKIAHLRSTLTINHLVVYTPPSGVPILARKQIYANHYFEGAFELLAVFDAPSLAGSPGVYLVSVRRYRFDSLPSGGFLNIRGRVRNQLAGLVRSDLEKERQANESPR